MVGNYSITYATKTDGEITKLPITLTASTNTKVYDGTISATATPTITLGSLASGDVGTYSETYDTKGQGTGKTLTPSVISILDATSVSMVGNYSITYATKTDGVITAKQLTISDPTITKSKEYDKTVTANATAGALLGVVTVGLITDDATVTATGTYSTSTVGTAKTITVVYTLAGADKDNYIKPVDKVYSDGIITPKTLTITAASIASREYDGTKKVGTITVGTLSGFISPETITATAVGTDYTNANVGTYSSTISYTLADGTNGGIASNYSLVAETSNGAITAKAITITVNAGQKKTYGVSDPATYTYSVSPTISGLTSLIGNLSRATGEDVNTYAVQQNNLTTDANPNYTISYVANTFKIEQKLINVIADDKSKNYNKTDPVFTYNYSPMPLVGSDIFSGVLERVAGESAGVYDIKQGTLSLSSNYQLNFTKGLLTILPESNAYFQIPNAFVPGSFNELDNKFRVFKNSAFPDNLFKSLSIYNRSGQFLKRFDAITDSWDGRVDTVLQESDVYIWVLSLVDDPLTKNIPRSGTFLLLK